MSDELEARAVLDEHPLQYAIVEKLWRPDPIVYGTEQLSDDEVLNALRREPIHYQLRHMLEHRKAYPARVVRFNRCPTCEQWSPCDGRRERERRWAAEGWPVREDHPS